MGGKAKGQCAFSASSWQGLLQADGVVCKHVLPHKVQQTITTPPHLASLSMSSESRPASMSGVAEVKESAAQQVRQGGGSNQSIKLCEAYGTHIKRAAPGEMQ
jgi:hypothetical protein